MFYIGRMKIKYVYTCKSLTHEALLRHSMLCRSSCTVTLELLQGYARFILHHRFLARGCDEKFPRTVSRGIDSYSIKKYSLNSNSKFEPSGIVQLCVYIEVIHLIQLASTQSVGFIAARCEKSFFQLWAKRENLLCDDNFIAEAIKIWLKFHRASNISPR